MRGGNEDGIVVIGGLRLEGKCWAEIWRAGSKPLAWLKVEIVM